MSASYLLCDGPLVHLSVDCDRLPCGARYLPASRTLSCHTTGDNSLCTMERARRAKVRMEFAREFPGECCEEVSRGGVLQPCDKTAVAVHNDEEFAYPVCAYHARGDMVPLTELLGG